MNIIRTKLYKPYVVMLSIYLFFLIVSFILDTPLNIVKGLVSIIESPSILVTDYSFVGGFSAMLVNAVIVGLFSIGMLMFLKVKPNGAIIMALWLNTGFAFFGKNILNMIPLIAGVLLYARVKKEPFINFTLVALLSATLSPVVSSISFMGLVNPFVDIVIGIAIGVVIGFIFPPISAYVVRAHAGYDLYNMGFAGGLISALMISVLKSFGKEIPTVAHWTHGQSVEMIALLYIMSAILLAFGFFSNQRANTIHNLKKIMHQPGRLVSDFYILYKDSIYVNMAILCIFSTTLSLVLGFDLNGPVMGGILTVVGFAGFGKHLRNIIPVLIGAVLSTYVNMWDPTTPFNSLAILFSTGLAPIAGQFGWKWGIVAGFIHVNLAIHIGYLSSGLNLYNNGFAAGFVSLLLVPLILAFRKDPVNE